MLNLTPVVKVLIIINVAVYFLSEYVFDLNMLFALRYFESPLFYPWQYFTYMFAHGGFMHIFFNMFGLFMFGPMLEQYFGSKRFLIFYIVCGVGAGLIYTGITYFEVANMKGAAQAYLENPTPTKFSSFIRTYAPSLFSDIREWLVTFKDNPTDPGMIVQSEQFVNSIWERKISVPMVGASGAIFGILMGFGLLFPNVEMFLLFLPIPIKAKYFVLFYGAYELYAGMNRTPGDNVAHFAHLGGMLFAFILIKIWQKNNYREY